MKYLDSETLKNFSIGALRETKGPKKDSITISEVFLGSDKFRIRTNFMDSP